MAKPLMMRQDSMRQDSMRQDPMRQDSMRQGSDAQDLIAALLPHGNMVGEALVRLMETLG